MDGAPLVSTALCTVDRRGENYCAQGFKFLNFTSIGHKKGGFRMSPAEITHEYQAILRQLQQTQTETALRSDYKEHWSGYLSTLGFALSDASARMMVLANEANNSRLS
jgi:hypothetical protein